MFLDVLSCCDVQKIDISVLISKSGQATLVGVRQRWVRYTCGKKKDDQIVWVEWLSGRPDSE